ncbi:hypothetical protein PI124_g21295 [Phytophthora idaei]|nr:hypothetical protein PI125_g22702 [Phytophthora idaei]KAG3233634.1 hypothetical protein PI124_g21295 [Phytophthora idaei]
MTEAENTNYRNQLAQQRRQRDAEWHRCRRGGDTRKEKSQENDLLDQLLQESDDDTHVSDTQYGECDINQVDVAQVCPVAPVTCDTQADDDAQRMLMTCLTWIGTGLTRS